MAAAGKGKEKKGAGLAYGMVCFAGSRQPPGPSEAALARLRSDGLLREEEAAADEGKREATADESSRGSAAATPSAESIEAVPTGSTVEAAPTSAPAERASPRPKAKRGVPGATPQETAKPRPQGRRIQPRSAYTLERVADADGPARSVHFRLPALVDRYIDELAHEHECSRTHVVCALVVEARERRRRGRRGRRGGDGAPPAA